MVKGIKTVDIFVYSCHGFASEYQYIALSFLSVMKLSQQNVIVLLCSTWTGN